MVGTGAWQHDIGLSDDKRLEQIQNLVRRLSEQTGLHADAITQASAQPVVLLSMAFEASSPRPKLAEHTVRQLKTLLDSHGLSYKGLLERQDLVTMAADSGLKEEAEKPDIYRIEAVLEGNAGQWRSGQGSDSFRVVSVAGTPMADHREAAKAAAARVSDVPQWWKSALPKPADDVAPWALPPTRWPVQQATRRVLTWVGATATALLGLAEADEPANIVAGVALILGGGGLLGIAAVFATLEFLGRRRLPGRLPGQAASPAQLPMAAGGPDGAAPAGGARVDFWPRVRVRRFAEDDAELASRRAHWSATRGRAYQRSVEHAAEREAQWQAAPSTKTSPEGRAWMLAQELFADEADDGDDVDLQAEIDALKQDPEFAARRAAAV
jgi:hypothetical protein